MKESTRAWIYRILTPLSALVIAYGVVDEQKAALWVALAMAVFSGGLAIKNTSTTAEC